MQSGDASESRERMCLSRGRGSFEELSKLHAKGFWQPNAHVSVTVCEWLARHREQLLGEDVAT